MNKPKLKEFRLFREYKIMASGFRDAKVISALNSEMHCSDGRCLQHMQKDKISRYVRGYKVIERDRIVNLFTSKMRLEFTRDNVLRNLRTNNSSLTYAQAIEKLNDIHFILSKTKHKWKG